MHKRDDLSHILYASFFNANERKVNRTFMSYLNKLKSNIDGNVVAWSKFKRYTNPYEFIHTPDPTTSRSVSSLAPLSRSYYKMVEMSNTFDLLDQKPQMRTFHLAEGPGGFIEALCDLRKNSGDIHYGMTLTDPSNQSVPGWGDSETFLNANPNVFIEHGATKNGDITSPENLVYCYQKYRGTMDLVTGDAGVDYSFDFALQEQTSANLILCQIAFGCAMLKPGGAFVVKMFDISTIISVDLLYFLSLTFDSVHMFKPNTSRYANSERYIVCQGFRFANNVHIANFFCQTMNHGVSRLFSQEVPYMYLSKLEETNAIIGQQQVEHILFTLSLLENPKPQRLETMRRRHVALCVKWCEKHGIPTHSVNQNNIFTQQCVTR